jgi:mobilome CxxCx(11)CxxC protein
MTEDPSDNPTQAAPTNPPPAPASMPETVRHINQKRFDSLVAKNLHKRARQRLNKLNLSVDIVALLLPIVGLPVRYILKGGAYAQYADVTWEILAGLLLALVLLKIICRWQENALLHTKLMGENISIVSITDALLADKAKISADLPALRQLLDMSETEDSDLLGDPKESFVQWAYRQALRETDKIEAKCPVCKRSAWKYKKKWGWEKNCWPWENSTKCQACGNTD